ncbi:thiamine pyrophosphate-binding protein [Reyranella sp.]|jgi:indolepyruvate decarboxylase|uniref:alpha-keto acid decarboxylase family protein n=1 Tax=Reyranella sp. TaxID=1929291 RepID=UPI000BD9F052|nr:thiamine pyrophosphate-binding protein [Reyranella sp.]OYY42347.1 MAG: indolepyruvate decarboxylase [Rhodospirillales bacterium 35-66-84]OYZ94033.1 MAG: indolepyruvate decarboxylase [Rhodospirillales bacterium 24-66-33]OZB22318.1 MAG: indolepyruvate decarboxylase [Rhodospirillales bacterium 39-66-50]HQS17566.1 thiamine pyrophosphate-binding protein [Reyranella sp.]HQT14305.1 thiamine pyrophosphate-binding protein [Reyranella sp.]
MAQPTVAQYTLARLAQLGIDRIFGVPGDYAFAVDDAAEKVPGLSWVGCANELNAAYAADGYARVRGAAILSTTYGVGELSALNGVMGSRAHRLPVFHLVGMPSQRIQHLGLLTHHNLGDTVYDRFQPLSGAACCVIANLTPDNCIDEMERVIREALRQSLPAYIAISQVNGNMPVVGTPVEGKKLSAVKRQGSVPTELEAAVATILSRIAAARNPVAIVTHLVARYGVAARATEFVKRSNLPFALMPNDKGTMDESLPQYMGLYSGIWSSSPAVCEAVEAADLIVDVGGLLTHELNTGMWTSVPKQERILSIQDNWVRAGDKVFLNVAIEDVLAALAARVPTREGANLVKVEQLPVVGTGADTLSSDAFYPRLQRALRQGDSLVIETGTCMTRLNRMLLPAGVSAEGQGLWGSIGWATPACMGVEMAKTSGRTWMVTGDGSHQLTLNELAVMGRYKTKPVIFVLNNGLYGVEDVISERGHPYDDLAKVNYHLLPQAFGCEGWLTAKVTTVAELDNALDRIEAHDGAAYIEVMIPGEESQPLPESIIDRAYKLRTPSAG